MALKVAALPGRGGGGGEKIKSVKESACVGSTTVINMRLSARSTCHVQQADRLVSADGVPHIHSPVYDAHILLFDQRSKDLF